MNKIYLNTKSPVNAIISYRSGLNSEYETKGFDSALSQAKKLTEGGYIKDALIEGDISPLMGVMEGVLKDYGRSQNERRESIGYHSFMMLIDNLFRRTEGKEKLVNGIRRACEAVEKDKDR